MLNDLNLGYVLFLDIETVPEVYDYAKLDDEKKKLWDTKSGYMQKDDLKAEDVYEKAGIYAEFGRIVCISVGFIKQENEKQHIRLKSFASHSEKELLSNFITLLNKYYSTDHHLLCAHNGKEFDFPYLARRILINRLPLPSILDVAGKKPWEINHLDTMELWKFGDYKHYTSLSLLTNIFDIPTPKDDITGADVGEVYWKDNDLDRIVTYCEKDVIATIQLFMRYQGNELISEANIMSV